MKALSKTSFLSLLASLAVIAFCLYSFSDNKADVDLWGNLGFVDNMPWQPGFNYQNTYSFTEPAADWINHEWLGQYLLNRTLVLFGNTGLLALKLGLGLAVIGLIYFGMKRTTTSGFTRFITLLVVISTMGYGFSTRPHHFTYLMYSTFLFVLFDRSRPPKSGIKRFDPICILPLLALFWTNLHGAFFIGILLLLIFTTTEALRYRLGGHGRPLRQLLTVCLLVALVSLINPYRAELWSFIFQSGAQLRPYLSEWAPFNPLTHASDHADFMALVFLTIMALCFTRRKRDISEITILTMSFIAALLMRRNIPLFAITAGFVIAPHLESLVAAPAERMAKRIPALGLAIFPIVLMIISLRYAAFHNKKAPLEIEVEQSRFPVRTVAFMQANGINGNAIVFFDWAEYCIWKLPRSRIFLDGRFRSAYSADVIDDFLSFIYLKDEWENALEHYPTDIVLIHKGNPVYGQMIRNRSWQLVFKDPVSALFLKKEAHAAVLKRMLTGDVAVPVVQEPVLFP